MVGNLITLYEHDETEFKSNGLGSLIDAASCSVYEERNGEFELTMEYPVTGRHFSDLALRRIIFAKPNPYGNAQPFRIYDISKPIDGIVNVSAHHISYDLMGYPIAPFQTESLTGVFEEMNSQMKQSWNSKKPPFTFSTTKDETAGEFNLVAPCNARALLGGSEGTILDRWPGEYEWDRWNVRYYQHRGDDRGVVIEYGKNLTDLQQDENCENCWTGVYPYYYTEPQTDSEGNTTCGLVQLSNKIINLPGTYDHQRILILDLSSEFQEQPTEAELRERTNKYIEDNTLDEPDVSLTVSFVSLESTTNYKDFKFLEQVRLCDTVSVYFPLLNVSSTARCISTTYNVITDKYTEIELGKAKSNLASTISGQSEDVDKQINDRLHTFDSEIEANIKHQTELITGNTGGHIVLHDTDGDGRPDELLILETDDLSATQNIWRFNAAGLGHSSNGYMGPYKDVALTMDGAINASYITVGELIANIIKSGKITSKNGLVYFDLDGNEITCSRLVSTEYNGPQRPDQTVLTFGYKNTGGYSSIVSSATLKMQTLSMEETDSISFSISKQLQDASGTTYAPKSYIQGPKGGKLKLRNTNDVTGHTGPQVNLIASRGGTDKYAYVKMSAVSYELTIGGETDQLSWSGSAKISNNLTVTGTITSPREKHRVISTNNYGDRLLTCYETASPMFGDIGFGETDNDGKSYILINPIFTETITKAEYHVFLQPEGDGSLYVSEKTNTHFLVIGTPNLRFSWEIKGHQLGSDFSRLEDNDAISYDFDYVIRDTIIRSEHFIMDEISKVIQEQEESLYAAT